MSGKTKRKYQSETMRLSKSMTRPLNQIVKTLKPGYTGKELLARYREYYPYVWEMLEERYRVYRAKDAFLKRKGKKTRYHPVRAEKFFFSLQKVKQLLSHGYRVRHEREYDEAERARLELEYRQKCERRNAKTRRKREEQHLDLQEIDPGFLDAMMVAYHQRGVTTNDKMEICKEIQKFDCEKVWAFFWKLNDSERNDQIREYAFHVLQRIGHYVRLRKHFKGKQKSYMREEADLVGTPELLAQQLRQQKSVQYVKMYDLFVSHSYQDKEQVRSFVKKANAAGLSCYVDWTADREFLRRSLVSQYTEEVLKFRMQHAKKLAYLSSERSRASKWVAFELQYYRDIVQREILMIVLDGEDLHDFSIVESLDAYVERK